MYMDNQLNKLPRQFKKEAKATPDNGVWITGHEPYFGHHVWVATVDFKTKTIRPCHGYHAPHKYGKAIEKYAKKIGFTFNNN